MVLSKVTNVSFVSAGTKFRIFFFYFYEVYSCKIFLHGWMNISLIGLPNNHITVCFYNLLCTLATKISTEKKFLLCSVIFFFIYCELVFKNCCLICLIFFIVMNGFFYKFYVTSTMKFMHFDSILRYF
jgi:hypothetical protein